MRTRRAGIAGGFRDQRNWFETATDLGALHIYLTDYLYQEDKVGGIRLPIEGNPSTLSLAYDSPKTNLGMDFWGGASCLDRMTSFGHSAQKNWSLECCFRSSPTAHTAHGIMAFPGFASLSVLEDELYTAQGIMGSSFISVGSYADDQWHHVVRTRGEFEDRIYIDGELVNSWPGSGVDTNIDFLSLGNFTGFYDYNGELASVALYDKTLSLTEVKSLHKSRIYDITYFEREETYNPLAVFLNHYDLNIQDLLETTTNIDNLHTIVCVEIEFECVEELAGTGSFSGGSMNWGTGTSGYWEYVSGGLSAFYSTGYLSLNSDYGIAAGPQVARYYHSGNPSWFEEEGIPLRLYSGGGCYTQINEVTVYWVETPPINTEERTELFEINVEIVSDNGPVVIDLFDLLDSHNVTEVSEIIWTAETLNDGPDDEPVLMISLASEDLSSPIASTWSDVPGIDSLSIDDAFFFGASSIDPPVITGFRVSDGSKSVTQTINYPPEVNSYNNNGLVLFMSSGPTAGVEHRLISVEITWRQAV